MLLLKDLQFLPDHYETLSKWGPHEYSKTSILEYQQMYSKIEVIYEVFKDFGLQQKIYL